MVVEAVVVVARASAAARRIERSSRAASASSARNRSAPTSSRSADTCEDMETRDAVGCKSEMRRKHHHHQPYHYKESRAPQRPRAEPTHAGVRRLGIYTPTTTTTPTATTTPYRLHYYSTTALHYRQSRRLRLERLSPLPRLGRRFLPWPPYHHHHNYSTSNVLLRRHLRLEILFCFPRLCNRFLFRLPRGARCDARLRQLTRQLPLALAPTICGPRSVADAGAVRCPVLLVGWCGDCFIRSVCGDPRLCQFTLQLPFARAPAGRSRLCVVDMAVCRCRGGSRSSMGVEK